LKFFKRFYLIFFLISVSCSAGHDNNGKGSVLKNSVLSGESRYSVPGQGDGHKLLMPQGYKPWKVKKKKFFSKYIRVDLFARKFAQGNAVYFEVAEMGKGKGPVKVDKVTFSGKNVPVTEKKWGYRGFIGIHPEAKPGYRKFVLNYKVNGERKVLKRLIYVHDVKYVVSRKRLNLGKFSNRNYYKDPKFRKLIIKSSKLKKAAFRIDSEDKIDNIMSHPRDMHKITGVFWKKRIYLSYAKRGKKLIKKKTRVRYHRGLDFKGAVGSPIYSLARGKVVLSSKMFYEGNMVIVDHGNKIFSYYMHMSKRNVKPGDVVSAGDKLGEVGSTGMSTGPHLHLSVVIRGVQVHPLSFICLPVRK